jgi:hypothetical protein
VIYRFMTWISDGERSHLAGDAALARDEHDVLDATDLHDRHRLVALHDVVHVDTPSPEDSGTSVGHAGGNGVMVGAATRNVRRRSASTDRGHVADALPVGAV